MLDRCQRERRWASADEQVVLAHWAGWGALPQIFDDSDDRYASERAALRRLVGDDQAWAAARRSTLNAHYTSAEVVQAMWRTAQALGFDQGRVLEPGCGSGNFIGFAPAGAELVGVELDPTTAAIADHLYGARARIHADGFEDFAAPDGSYDLAIGNVPFAKVSPYDPRHNRGNATLHNYFLIKSLALTRPAGLVLALTSRYTLDARNPASRREMARYADLVGAVRLPARAFAAAAGTDVVVDLVILRRREPGTPPADTTWIGTVPIDPPDGLPTDTVEALGAEPLVINTYLARHPDQVLGRLGVDRGMYRQHELTVQPDGALGPRLAEALERLVAVAVARGATFTPAPARPADAPTTVRGDFELRHAQEGSLVVDQAGHVGRYLAGRVEAYRPRNTKDLWELRRLVGLRDAARQVLAVQLRGGDELGAAQAQLRDRYDSYKRLYGPLNRYRLVRTGRTDPDTGTAATRRDLPRMGGFRALDPDWPLVAALEIFDDDTQTPTPAPIFTQQVVAPPARRDRVDNPADAVAVCLDESGMVTTERVAELLGIGEDEARSRLAGLVFEDPDSRELVPTARYLSGNVRHKLAAARAAPAAGADNPRWQANVTALEQVLPDQLGPGEITARLGAPWIPAGDIEAFCRETLDAAVDVDVEYHAELGRWDIALRAGSRYSVALSSQWGTQRADAIALLGASLNQRLYTVYDYLEDSNRRVRNDAETLAARDKQEALGDRFSAWVWEDPGRAERLAGVYNELFRSVVLPRHDGTHLSLPGLAATFTPRPHQRDAVARILTDGRALLAHPVGAGKTATMIMAAQELRRLGAAAKPAVIVPNHMLHQFGREWLQLYPTARILLADGTQLDKRHRKEFVARCAMGDWDGIVFTHSGFERIPLGPDLAAQYLAKEVDALRRAVESAKGGKQLSVKRLEKLLAQAEENYKRLLDARSKDDGVRFEQTGVDHVFVDEGHLFKNRRIVTSIDGVATKGSKRAQDLDSKLWALRRLHGPRTVTFATATPVANSMAELWVMQTYLQPDILDQAGVRPFDAWAATFGRTHTALELAPDGASYRMKTRFARFQNIPELLGLYHQVADVRSHDDLALPTPDISGDKPETVTVPASDILRAYVAELARRAEDIRNRAVNPEDDNMLKIAGDGRRAALDLRLVGKPPDPAGGKLAAAAARIAAIYHTHRDRPYRDAHGQPSPRTGALQLVFCDVSTPTGGGWNAYDELRNQLARRGVPAEQVRYMQQATTDQAKADLFAGARDGQIAVLIGSTETMGVGTNVQARAVALHHLDAPWRPADIEQRDGRILRQGNQNPVVEIVRYVTEGSFDTYVWQTLERKQGFLSQVSGTDFDQREIDDIDEAVLSFAEVKALATGDPRIMEKAGVDADVARLSRLERSWRNDQRRLRRLLDDARHTAHTAEERAGRLAAVAAEVTDTRGDRFTMTLDGRTWTKRRQAGEHLRDLLARQLAATPPETAGEPRPVGRLSGLDIHSQAITVIDDELRILIPALGDEIRLRRQDWETPDPIGLIQRIEHRIQRIPDTITGLRRQAADAAGEATRAETRLNAPWEHATEIGRLRRRRQELDDALTHTDTPDCPGTDIATSPPAPASASADHLDRLRQRLDGPHTPGPVGGISL